MQINFHFFQKKSNANRLFFFIKCCAFEKFVVNLQAQIVN